MLIFNNEHVRNFSTDFEHYYTKMWPNLEVWVKITIAIPPPPIGFGVYSSEKPKQTIYGVVLSNASFLRNSSTDFEEFMVQHEV